MKLTSPALVGGFFITELPGKPTPPKEETNGLIYKRVIDLQTITLWLTKEKGEQGIN